MFHRKLLDSTETKKLIGWQTKGKRKKQGVKHNECWFSFDPCAFSLVFVQLTAYFDETPSCR
jgi:hypothetical protein